MQGGPKFHFPGFRGREIKRPGSTCWEDNEGAGSMRALNIVSGGGKRSLNFFPSSSVIVKKCFRIFPTSSFSENFPFSDHVNIELEWLRINNPRKRGQLQLGKIIRRWANLCLLKELGVFKTGRKWPGKKIKPMKLWPPWLK